MTHKWFRASVSADVDLKMSLLEEALVAVRHVALVSFPRLLSSFGLLRLYVRLAKNDTHV